MAKGCSPTFRLVLRCAQDLRLNVSAHNDNDIVIKKGGPETGAALKVPPLCLQRGAGGESYSLACTEGPGESHLASLAQRGRGRVI